MEYMTNLQVGFDELKPSLFELLSEHQLSTLLPPSLRYLLAVATHRHPRYLLRLLNSFDEVYALLSLLIERHFLLTYGGGFTENFYGLKRQRVLRVKGGELPRAQIGAASTVNETLKLRSRDVWANLAIIVGLPYLKQKLDEGYDVHAAHVNVLGQGYNPDRAGLAEEAIFKQRFMYYYKWFLRKVYPSVNAAYHFALLAFNLAYLFDGTKYHSPLMWLVGTRIRRMADADYKAIDLASHNPSPSSSTSGLVGGERKGMSSVFHPKIMVDTIYPRMLSSLRILLPTSIFALKFLEWWHQSDFARQLSRKAAEAIDLPPPITSAPPQSRVKKDAIDRASSSQSLQKTSHPESSVSSKAGDKLPISSSTLLPIFTTPLPSSSARCPICTSPIITATASPYGYVYCYTCIHKWVLGEHPRQEAFMEGSPWRHGNRDGGAVDSEHGGWETSEGSREGRWESGKGRDAVTGKRILGGTEGLRRVVV